MIQDTSPKIDVLRDLYRDSPVAHAFLDLAAGRERDRSETKVDRIWRLLIKEGQVFERREIIALFRELEKAGCGQFVEGRRGWPSRFVWSVGLTSVGRAAAGDAQPIAQISTEENGWREEGDGEAGVAEAALDGEDGVEELGEAGGTGLEEEIEPDDVGLTSEITQPFDPAKIRVETKPMLIQLLLDRIHHKEIDLAPGFQRKGGIWTAKAKSRLIESLLIRIPLPAFYMDGSDEGRWLVVDGLQRLSTLKSFALDKTLRLTGLEFLGDDYNGKTFDKLPRHLQRRILETQVTVFLIQENTPPEVKFTIFRRINTGGLPLSSQEIRHALNQGPASVLLQTLAESPEFKTATSDGIRDERMGDRECVLRLLAFIRTSFEEYKANNLDSFLNQCMADMNRLPVSELQELDRRFRRAMVDCYRVFGDRAFRKEKRGAARRLPINRALFEVWAANIEALTPHDVDRLVELSGSLQNRFLKLLEDPTFDSAISYGTGDPRKVEIRFTGVRTVILETLQ